MTWTNMVMAMSGALRGSARPPLPSGEAEEVDHVEPGGILDAPVKGMGPAEDLAHRPGGGKGYAEGAQEAGVEKADRK